MTKLNTHTNGGSSANLATICPAVQPIIHRSAAMRDVIEQNRRAACAGCTVLIVGESGTGKELIAAAIHKNSSRKDGPYQVVNMAAIPVTLVESELFGHRRGSFTGAVESRIGCFEMANGGTLFIDEIGDFELSSQAKLLRVLESHRFTPVGESHEKNSDVRVVAATSRNLELMLEQGTFREDLYYRLNVVTIYLPGLRERGDDIMLLAGHFLKIICLAQGVETLSMDQPLCEFLERFDWPGNVRQLRNCIESMVVMARNHELTISDLPTSIIRHHDSSGVSPQLVGEYTMVDVEKGAIDRTLKHHNGNRTRAAKSLGISVRTLRRRLNGAG